jgi:hypothetical protein
MTTHDDDHVYRAMLVAYEDELERYTTEIRRRYLAELLERAERERERTYNAVGAFGVSRYSGPVFTWAVFIDWLSQQGEPNADESE